MKSSWSLSTVLVWLAVFGALTTISFQNCSGSKFSTTISDEDKKNLTQCDTQECRDILNGKASCSFGGAKVPHGQSVTAFMTSTVASGQTCVSQQRACNNGVLTGTYNFSACSPNSGSACLFNGVQVSDGQSVQAFQASVAGAGGCVSESRVCQGGVLSGSFQFATCNSSGGNNACLFNGLTIPHNSGVIGFQASTVGQGQSCLAEFRLCQNGTLTGTFAFGNCMASSPASCVFNGQTLPSATSVVAFQNSTVPFGQNCVSESRNCSNGTLSGSYSFSTCQVGAPALCSFNGQNLAHGSSVTAYQASSVPFGQTCVGETRSCSNGALSGSYNFATCQVGAPASCLFNGATLSSGNSVTAYRSSTVAYNQTCEAETRNCSNGALSGSYAFASCSVQAPASCLFDGRTIAHGEFVTAFQNSSVPYSGTCQSERRQCVNGSLTGSYNFSSCNVSQPASCLFNGQTVSHGAGVVAYQGSSVAFGGSCVSEIRTCSNGSLSGTFGFGSCAIGQPRSCLFNGQTIVHGATVKGYQSSNVAFGSTCREEERLCNDGTLSGTFAFASCQVGQPASCLFNGQTVAHRQYVLAFPVSTVAFNTTCAAETRYCNNGVLSGTAAFATCSPAPGANCTFNGMTVAHGASVIGYLNSTEPSGTACRSETRSCFNGALSGSYSRPTCQSGGSQNCTLGGVTILDGTFATAYFVNVGDCNSQIQYRSCSNGTLSGSAPFASCTPVAP